MLHYFNNLDLTSWSLARWPVAKENIGCCQMVWWKSSSFKGNYS